MGTDPSSLIVAMVAVGVLALLMRWIFRPSHRTGQTRRVDASDSPELGLLAVVATDLPRAAAIRVRARLWDAGLRSSMSRRKDGNLDVLVFFADVDKARALLR